LWRRERAVLDARTETVDGVFAATDRPVSRPLNVLYQAFCRVHRSRAAVGKSSPDRLGTTRKTQSAPVRNVAACRACRHEQHVRPGKWTTPCR